MRLGVNGWRVHGPRTGIGRYLVNVVSRWAPEVLGDRFDSVSFYCQRPVDPEWLRLPPDVHERVLRPEAPMLVWENLRFAPAAGDDVLFCPSYTRPLVARGRTVIVLHDATWKMRPEMFGRAQKAFYNPLYEWSIRHATLILTSTEAARTELIEYCGAPPSRLRVVPLAPAVGFHRLDDQGAARAVADRVSGSTDPFFLFVGKSTGRRRVEMLVDAFLELKRIAGSPHKLLLVGPEPTVDKGENGPCEAALADVRRCGFITDADLNALYNTADAVVCPSVYETVSFPMMEAQAAGAPLVCIDTPGSRETTGDAAEFLAELTVAGLVGAMARLAGDSRRREELRRSGLVNAARLSWERTAAGTLDVLAEAAGAAGA